MQDPADLDGILVRVQEKQPIISYTQPDFLDVLQALQVARAGFHEAVKSVEDPHGSRSVKSTDISLGLSRPNDPLQAGSS